MKLMRRALLTVLLPVLGAGCVSLGRESPQMELYVIGGDVPAAGLPPVPGLAGVSIGVRRLQLAPYLATASIVVRRGAHEVLTSDYHRWGEDLAEGINRATARHIAEAGQFRTVDVAPWPVRSRYDYLVQVEISRFEGAVPAAATAPGGTATGGAGAAVPAAGAGATSAAGGEAHMVANWEIIRQQDETVLTRGTTEFREGGWRAGDYAALVALLDRGLAVLARDITAALGRVVAAGSGPE